MDKKIKIIKCLMYIGFIVITIRLFSLQVINNSYYKDLVDKKNIKIIEGNTTLRGRIYDTNNKLLVDNQLIMTIIYQKKEGISKKEEIDLAYKISPLISLNYNKLTISYLKDFYILTNPNIEKRMIDEYSLYKNRKITYKEYYKLMKDKVTEEDLSIYTDDDKKAIYLYYLMNNGYSYMEKIIKNNCTLEEFLYFSENNTNLSGFDTKYTYGRLYLYDTLKSVLGSVGSIPSDNREYYLSRGYNISDTVGLTGLELVYDEYLKGERDIYQYSNNEKMLVKEGKLGPDLILTIDISLQEKVDNILEKEIIKAKNSFNSRYFKHSYVTITDTYGSIKVMSGKEYLNGQIVDVSIGNITDTITPGSSIKAASMLVGFNEGAIKMGEVIYDECMKIKNTPKKCSVYKMGNISDINALAYSSNVYQFKTALRVGGGVYKYGESLKIKNETFDIYREYFGRFGLGVNTGIELLNESRGYKGKTRNAGLLMDFAIGQYDTYTNMQLNQYISTIARDGDRYKMHLMKEIRDSENKEIIKENGSIILNNVNIDFKYIERVKKGLKAVTSYGTGKNYTNIDSSGKTGTSESFMDTDNDGKIDMETTSTSFVMYTPSINPKYALSITSPNIAYKKGYKYPINQYVIKAITNIL